MSAFNQAAKQIEKVEGTRQQLLVTEGPDDLVNKIVEAEIESGCIGRDQSGFGVTGIVYRAWADGNALVYGELA